MAPALKWVAVCVVYAVVRTALASVLGSDARWRLATTFGLVASDASSVHAADVFFDQRCEGIDRLGPGLCLATKHVPISIAADVFFMSLAAPSPSILAIALLNPFTLLAGAAGSCWWRVWALPAFCARVLNCHADAWQRQLLVAAAVIVAVTVSGDVSLLCFAACLCCHQRLSLVRFGLITCAAGFALFTARGSAALARFAVAAPSVPPSVGVYWYMLQLVFPQYERFVVGLYQLCPVLITLPLAGKVAHSSKGPLLVLCVAAAAHAMTMQETVMVDLIFVATLTVFALGPVLAEMPYTFAVLTTFAIALPLQAAFYHAWVFSQVTNPNFVFFSGAAIMLATVIFIVQLARTFLRMHKSVHIKAD